MSNAYKIIKTVMVTEKASSMIEAGKYTFKVAPGSNKVEIAKAVEEVFGVKVKAVNTLNYLGKTKRRGAHVGKRADWKKAVVTLAPGQTIEIF